MKNITNYLHYFNNSFHQKKFEKLKLFTKIFAKINRFFFEDSKILHFYNMMKNNNANDEAIYTDRFLKMKLFNDSFKNLPKDEEYFEWLSLIDSILKAKNEFTMIELGAGHGRWGAISHKITKFFNLNPKIKFCEADPQKVKMLRENLQFNNIKEDDYFIFNNAISSEKKEINFYIGMPQINNEENPTLWYGQSISKDYEQQEKVSKNQYFGHDVIEFKSKWRAIKISTISLEDMLQRDETVDLVDMDIQGAELEVIENSIEIINKKVKKLHISTHSRENDKKIKAILAKNKWRKNFAFKCFSLNLTKNGIILFNDGHQSWDNTKI